MSNTTSKMNIPLVQIEWIELNYLLMSQTIVTRSFMQLRFIRDFVYSVDVLQNSKIICKLNRRIRYQLSPSKSSIYKNLIVIFFSL